LETPFCSGTGWGESGKGEEAHHGANSERKRLGTAVSRGGRKTPATVSLCACTDGSRSEERGTGEEKETCGSQPTTYPGAGRGELGSGLRLGRSAERERDSGATVGEGDEPDGWAPPVSRQRGRGGRGEIGWAAAQEGARGLGQNGRKEGRGREKAFSFLFSKQIFQTIFQLNF